MLGCVLAEMIIVTFPLNKKCIILFPDMSNVHTFRAIDLDSDLYITPEEFTKILAGMNDKDLYTDEAIIKMIRAADFTGSCQLINSSTIMSCQSLRATIYIHQALQYWQVPVVSAIRTLRTCKQLFVQLVLHVSGLSQKIDDEVSVCLLQETKRSHSVSFPTWWLKPRFWRRTTKKLPWTIMSLNAPIRTWTGEWRHSCVSDVTAA